MKWGESEIPVEIFFRDTWKKRCLPINCDYPLSISEACIPSRVPLCSVRPYINLLPPPRIWTDTRSSATDEKAPNLPRSCRKMTSTLSGYLSEIFFLFLLFYAPVVEGITLKYFSGEGWFNCFQLFFNVVKYFRSTDANILIYCVDTCYFKICTHKYIIPTAEI